MWPPWKSSTLQQSSILKRNTTSESKRRHYTDGDEPVEARSNTPAVKEAKAADPEAVKPLVTAAIEVESTNLEVEEVKVGDHEAVNLEAADTHKDQRPEDSDEMQIKGFIFGVTNLSKGFCTDIHLSRLYFSVFLMTCQYVYHVSYSQVVGSWESLCDYDMRLFHNQIANKL